ncbi:hypothetical protein ACUOFC_45245, partial [Escherichia sp. TWPC-MK]
MSWQEKINAALDARRAADALRRRYPVAQGAGRWLVADDRQFAEQLQVFIFFRIRRGQQFATVEN